MEARTRPRHGAKKCISLCYFNYRVGLNPHRADVCGLANAICGKGKDELS